MDYILPPVKVRPLSTFSSYGLGGQAVENEVPPPVPALPSPPIPTSGSKSSPLDQASPPAVDDISTSDSVDEAENFTTPSAPVELAIELPVISSSPISRAASPPPNFQPAPRSQPPPPPAQINNSTTSVGPSPHSGLTPTNGPPPPTTAEPLPSAASVTFPDVVYRPPGRSKSRRLRPRTPMPSFFSIPAASAPASLVRSFLQSLAVTFWWMYTLALDLGKKSAGACLGCRKQTVSPLPFILPSKSGEPEVRVHCDGGLEVEFVTMALDRGKVAYQIWRSISPLDGRVDADILYFHDYPLSGGVLPSFARSFLHAGYRLIVPDIRGTAQLLNDSKPSSPTEIRPAPMDVCDIATKAASVLRDVRRADDERRILRQGFSMGFEDQAAEDKRTDLEASPRIAGPAPSVARPVFILGLGFGGLVALSYPLINPSVSHGSSFLPWPSYSTLSSRRRRFGALISSLIKGRPAVSSRTPHVPASIPISGVIAISPLVDPSKADNSGMAQFGISPDPKRKSRQSGLFVTQPCPESREAVERLRQGAIGVRVPILIQHGTKDPFTSAAAVSYLYTAIGASDKTVFFFPGLHHISGSSDSVKAAIAVDSMSWMSERLGRREAADVGQMRSRVRFVEQSVRIGGPSFDIPLEGRQLDTNGHQTSLDQPIVETKSSQAAEEHPETSVPPSEEAPSVLSPSASVASTPTITNAAEEPSDGLAPSDEGLERIDEAIGTCSTPATPARQAYLRSNSEFSTLSGSEIDAASIISSSNISESDNSIASGPSSVGPTTPEQGKVITFSMPSPPSKISAGSLVAQLMSKPNPSLSSLEMVDIPTGGLGIDIV